MGVLLLHPRLKLGLGLELPPVAGGVNDIITGAGGAGGVIDYIHTAIKADVKVQ